MSDWQPAWLRLLGFRKHLPNRELPASLIAEYHNLLEELQTACARIGHPALAHHDLRRTCAKPCRGSGGDLEQIQFLLGHASVQTTERFHGSRQNLAQVCNESIGLMTLPQIGVLIPSTVHSEKTVKDHLPVDPELESRALALPRAGR